MGILRLLLALSVVANHFSAIFGFNLVGGQIAVQSFYIISGFYMSLILNEKYIGINNSYKLFITNRFIRLYPIYWAVLLLTVCISLGVLLLNAGTNIPIISNYLIVNSNLPSFAYLTLTNSLIFGQDLVMFLGINPDNGNLFFTSDFSNTFPQLHSFLFVPQAWTLGLELTFYLIAPFILKKGIGFVLSLTIISFLLRLFLYNNLGLQNDPWTYRFFPTEIMFFLFGYFSYKIYLKNKSKYKSIEANSMILLFIIAITFLYQFIPILKVSYLPFSLNDCFYFISITIAIPFLFNFFKKNRWDNKIGELSYPVYISHIIVGLVCTKVPYLNLKEGWTIALFTIGFSYILNKFIASPIEKFRQSRIKA